MIKTLECWKSSQTDTVADIEAMDGLGVEKSQRSAEAGEDKTRAEDWHKRVFNALLRRFGKEKNAKEVKKDTEDAGKQDNFPCSCRVVTAPKFTKNTSIPIEIPKKRRHLNDCPSDCRKH